jgi:hypothetical protein
VARILTREKISGTRLPDNTLKRMRQLDSLSNFQEGKNGRQMVQSSHSISACVNDLKYRGVLSKGG